MKYFSILLKSIYFLLFCFILPSLAAEEGKPSSLKSYIDQFYNFKVEDKEAIPPPRKLAIPLTLLPRDKYGLIDWAGSIRSGIISPIPSLDGTIDDDPIDLLVFIKSKKNFMTNVLFPHSIHTYWLSCKNCHPGIFVQKAGGNEEMTMWDILKGKYCGRCHGRVAFSLRECYRCHIERKPQDTMEEIENE